jgi:MEMO1 family protein
VAGAQEEPVLVVATAQMIRKESRKGMETLAIKQMMALDPRGLYGTIVEARVGMCGHEAATVALAACRSLGASRGELVEYVESDAASGDKLMIAGYAGLVFRG